MEASGAAAFLDGLRPAQTPKFAARLSASWERDGKGAEIVLRRVGAQYEDDLNTRVLKGATTFDAFASWPLTRRLQLVARGENLTERAGHGRASAATARSSGRRRGPCGSGCRLR